MEVIDSMKDTNSDKTNRSVFPDGSSLPEHKKAGTISGVVKVHESVIASSRAVVTGVAAVADEVWRAAPSPAVKRFS